MHRSRRHQPLYLPLIRVNQEPHHRHRIIRLIFDVRQNEHTRFVRGVQRETDDARAEEKQQWFGDHDDG